MSLATPYALHAVTADEERSIERQVAAAPELMARAFAEEVRSVRETMAVVSATTAAEPPVALRERLLAAVAQDAPAAPAAPSSSGRWRTLLLAAAAVVVVAGVALGAGIALRPAPKPSAAEQIFDAPDVRTVSGDIPTGGTATLVFSRERDSAVLVMNNVTPPEQGFVYQMWLVGNDGAHSAGTMDAGAVSPSTTAVLPDLGDSQALAFTVEPGSGSTQPTTPIFAELPLV